MVLEGWGAPDKVPGHEWSGTVAAVGPDASGVAVGDAVIGGPDEACGECRYCKANRPVLCVGRTPPTHSDGMGAFARYIRTRASRTHRIPPGMDMRVAALTEPLAVALHGITQGRVQPGSRVLVTGAGPIGLLSIAALRAMGIDDIVVSEPGKGRRQRALDVGATKAVTPDELQVPTFPTDMVDEPVDVVLECSGHAAAMQAGLAQLVPTGTLVLVGAGMRAPRFDPNRILLNELVITGAYCYDADGWPRALDLLASGRMPTDLLIEPDDVPLAGMQQAIFKLAAGELPGKVMVAPQKGITS
jgi:threonine dehydrogenase-like Zn-dependent dehydrogenase